jgi:hypothetical protein
MPRVDQRTQLFESLIRLRRAQHELPDNDDLQAVRAVLEQELGETVSQRFAARMLDVSHTALARWIEAGDLPLVYSSKGRNEVPVAALLDLYEAVQAERMRGERTRHVLEPALADARARAKRLRPGALVPRNAHDDVNGHGRAERRSLAYHRAVARDLRKPMVDDALRRIRKWNAEGKIDPHYADLWEETLRRPVREVRRAITADTELARDLRQNSPFAGMLSEPERRRILNEIR